MAKCILKLTLTALLALSLDELKVVFQELKGEEPVGDLTEEKLLEEILEAADPADEEDLSKKKVELPEYCFTYEDKTYKVILPKVFIPGIGVRTKLEIVTDEASQAYLVKENCIGSVIEEIIL